MSEWILPHEPELLYLREKVQRLEAELERLRAQPPGEDYSVLRHPITASVASILPASYRLATLEPLAYAQAANESAQGRYHIILQGGAGDGSIGYGYYTSHQELYSMVDICGLMAELHRRTVHSLAKFIEKKREEKR